MKFSINGVEYSTEYVKCKCGSVTRLKPLVLLYGGKCPLCRKSGDMEPVSCEEVEEMLAKAEPFMKDRLTDEEWDDKFCDVCGKLAETRAYDNKGHEIYRCHEHMITKEEADELYRENM